jgi:hypothetical protein
MVAVLAPLPIDSRASIRRSIATGPMMVPHISHRTFRSSYSDTFPPDNRWRSVTLSMRITCSGHDPPH